MGTSFFITRIALLLLTMAGLATAQTASSGALSGTLTDVSGGVIPNATVTVTSIGTGQVRVATTNSSGQYQIALLPPGEYKILFSASGFKPLEIASLNINVTEAPVIDRRLEVGGQAEQITVESNVEAVQTTTSTLGTVMGASSLAAIPLTTRNYTNLVGLSAGANAGVVNATGLGKGGVDISVNGASPTQNSYAMDGVNIVSSGNGSVVGGFYVGMAIPNPDTLQEFKIQTSMYDAGYGRNPGANVNVVTKSGTNEIHGTAFEFFRNTDLNATDFFRNRTCAVTPSVCAGGPVKQILNQNQFGGQIGGPIKKDKLFIFTAYQQTWQKNGSASQGFSSGITLPPIPLGSRGTTTVNGVDDAAAASFRVALGAAFCHSPTNPGGGGSGQGMQVACDGSNINPIAMRFLQSTTASGSYYMPSSGTSGNLSGVAYTVPAYEHEYAGMLNADYLLNSRNTITTKFYQSEEPWLVPFVNGGVPGNPGDANFGYTTGVAKLTTIVSNNLVNEFRGSVIRSVNLLEQDLSKGMTANAIYPICGAGVTGACAPTGHGLLGGTTMAPPLINISGLFSAFGANNYDVAMWQTNEAIGDALSWTKGKHTMRFGGESEAVQWNWDGSSLSHGVEAFQTFSDFLIGLPGACGAAALPSASNPRGCNGSSYSNILNTSSTSVLTGPGGLVHGYRIKNDSLFFQDDFKATRRLTVNMGIRWEYDGMLSDKYGNAVNLWPSAAAAVPVPSTTQTPTTGVPFYPTGGSYAGWVVPSNYDTKTWGALPAGIISSGNTVVLKSGSPKDDFAPRLGFAYQPEFSSKLVFRGGFGFFFDRVPGTNLVHALEQSPPYGITLDQGTSTNQFSSEQSPFLNLPMGSFPIRWVNFATNQGSDITESAMPEIIRTPLVYQWNTNIQYEFAPKWVLEVGYVGSHGIHLVQTTQVINGAAVASPTNPVNGVTTNAVQSGSSYTTNARLRVPILGLSPTGGQYSTTVGSEKFNSLQTTVRKQLSYGLTMQASYSFSRAFTNIPSNINNPLNLQAEYGLNTNYRPQRLTINYSWDVPSGRLHGFTSKVLGGWNLSGVTTIQDGTPLTITDTRGGAIYGLSGGTGTSSTAEIAPGMTYANIPTTGPLGTRLGGVSGGCGYFNCGTASPFTTIPSIDPSLPASVGSGWGNTGIGVLLGPGQFNFDTALLKNVRVGGIHENATLQFRAEFFNVFNHSQFSNPATVFSSGNFGQITSLSVNPRLTQLALKYVF